MGSGASAGGQGRGGRPGQPPEHLQRRHEEAAAHRDAAWARINHLARLEARLQELRDLSGLGHRRPRTIPRTGGCREPAIELPGGPPTELGWEGPHAPRITGRWATVILGCLVAVEIPIQYVIFQFFHGYSPVEEFLTWVFTIPVSAVMVLLPHLAGWWYRSRTATGSDRLLRVIPLVLLAPWAFLAVMLGYLRARVLLAPPPQPIATGDTSYLKNLHLANNATTLHVTPTTMAIMFSALVLGVGGISFLLGLAREHPFAGAYSGATARQGHWTGSLSGSRPRVTWPSSERLVPGNPAGPSAAELRIEARPGRVRRGRAVVPERDRERHRRPRGNRGGVEDVDAHRGRGRVPPPHREGRIGTP